MGSVFVGEGDLGSMEVVPGSGVGIPVNVADVELWVRELPKSLREVLARGPVNEDAEHASPSCGVCRIARLADSRGQKNAGVDFLHMWHAEVKDAPQHSDEGLCSYLRCLHVYLVAGWDGVHRDVDVCLACPECLFYYSIEHTDVSRPTDCCGAKWLVVEFEAQEIVWAGP